MTTPLATSSSNLIQVDPISGELSEFSGATLISDVNSITNAFTNTVNSNISNFTNTVNANISNFTNNVTNQINSFMNGPTFSNATLNNGTFNSGIINGQINFPDILNFVDTSGNNPMGDDMLVILSSDPGSNTLMTNYTFVVEDLGVNYQPVGIACADTLTDIYPTWHPLPTLCDGQYNFSIIAQNSIICYAFQAYSDERIKTNIVDIDTKNALNIIRQIKPRKYNYKDILNKGNKPEWGFIAQEVKSLIENSTDIITKFIPDIYEIAQVLDSNIIKLDIKTTINFEINEKIRLVKNNGRYLDTKITGILDTYTFTIEENLNQEHIFVYGREVHDLHTLNKDCIFTLATSALQQVDKELQNEKVLRQQLENKFIELQNKFIELENRFI